MTQSTKSNERRETLLVKESPILQQLSRQLVCNVQCSIVIVPDSLFPRGIAFTLGTIGTLSF